MTTLEYAAKHGMSRSKVVAACAEGRLPAVKHGGKTGPWEIIVDPEWPMASRRATLPPHLHITAEDKQRVARAIGLLARHWRRGMEIQLGVLRDAYQDLSSGTETATDIILGAHLEQPEGVWA